MLQESNYFKSLEGSDKITYKKMLPLTYGKVLPDLYVLKNDWEDGVKLLPDLEWPDISLLNQHSKSIYKKVIKRIQIT